MCPANKRGFFCLEYPASLYFGLFIVKDIVPCLSLYVMLLLLLKAAIEEM